MASWKKVVVSGSSAALSSITVDGAISNNPTSVAAGVQLTGSYTGSFTGDGSGLTGVTSTAESLQTTMVAGSTTSIPISSSAPVMLSGSGGIIIDSPTGTKGIDAQSEDGEVVARFAGRETPADTSVLIGVNSAVGTEVLTVGGSGMNVTNIINTGGITNSHLTGSFTGSFTGDGAGLVGIISSSTAISSSHARQADNATTADLASNLTGTPHIHVSSITASFVSSSGHMDASAFKVNNENAVSFTGNNLLIGNASGWTNVDIAREAADIVTVKGNLVVNTDITASTNISASGYVSASRFYGDGSGLTDITAAVAGTLSAGATGEDLTLSGDLNVAGTASFTNATNLSVADKYILLSSGSTSAGDGGIVIQQAAGNIGELFGFDSAADRFGITGSFDADTADNFAPDAFMSMVVSGSDSNPNNAPAKYKKAGNIFAALNGDVYIYGNA